MQKPPRELVAASSRPLVLGILALGESYGYEIIRQVKERSGGKLQWTDGMLYPVLHRLERDGLIRGSWSGEDLRRKRKSYSLTAKGTRYLGRQVEGWNRFIGHFAEIVEGIGS